MNKHRLVLPIASLLMIPCFVGCSKGDVYQASFNNDQIICTRGEQVIDISLEGNTKSKLHFKDTLDTSMFKLPEGYESKTIEAAHPYNKGSSAFILFTNEVALPEDKESIALEITVKKEAFKELALDSPLTVTLMPNQIRYVGYTHSTISEDDVFHFEAAIEMIGADAIVPQHSVLNNGKLDGYFSLTASDATVTGEGSVYLYELDGDKYFIIVESPVNVTGANPKFTLRFDTKSTTLDEYHCDVEADGLPSKDRFLFVK